MKEADWALLPSEERSASCTSLRRVAMVLMLVLAGMLLPMRVARVLVVDAPAVRARSMRMWGCLFMVCRVGMGWLVGGVCVWGSGVQVRGVISVEQSERPTTKAARINRSIDTVGPRDSIDVDSAGRGRTEATGRERGQTETHGCLRAHG